ncbi:ankyrin repeat-containing domain protein [Pseudomassariella vexata]|uniref:Ankyrin repeat-containing domain protein n=1 Tax=Pseudomassariella vexata TaxID=1141098 RepID=A0A1Y2EKR8_9PEZI|nr:ankyrin repeat-containing domain protein [Pseudomassariella vexata]ORY72121.1 ankyrin repeat-containing domain protein [Pseudomassariella vexata]
MSGTPLFCAARYGNLDLVKTLLGKGADAKVRGFNNSGILYVVALGVTNETTAIIDFLVKEGADIRDRGGLWGSPLNAAVARRHEYDGLDIVNHLVKLGVSVADQDDQGRCAIHITATNEGTQESFATLLEKDPDGLTRHDKQGRTVVHHAATWGNIKALRHIVELVNLEDRIKEMFSQPDNHGWTPLMWAGKQEHDTVVMFLMDNGASNVSRAHNNWTADDVARFHRQKNVNSRVAAARRRRTSRRRTAASASSFDSLNSYYLSTDSIRTSESSAESDIESARKLPLFKDGKPTRGGTRTAWACDGCITSVYGSVSKCQQCENFDFCFKCA